MMFQETAARVAVRETGAMLCLPYEGDELAFRVWLPRRRKEIYIHRNARNSADR